MPARYSTVLFDLDGTLIDSVRLILDSFHHTLATFGLPARTDDEWMDGIGTPLSAQLAEHARDGVTVTAMIEVYRAYNLAHHDRQIRVFPGAREAVEALAGAGVRLGLVTSKNRPGAHRGLRLAGLEAHIQVLVCAEDVTRAKPDREPVDRALALLGAAPDDALFVGDSVHDLRSGQAAGVRTAAAVWGRCHRQQLELAGPDHLLLRTDELVPLVLDGPEGSEGSEGSERELLQARG
jgi:pyrophosphatase PpaX